MFTVKLIQDNTTYLSFEEKVVISRKGSDNYQFVLDNMGEGAPDQIHLDVGAIDDAVHDKYVFEREGKSIDQLIAVLVYPAGCEIDGSIGQFSQMSFVCIYEGDELYVSLDGKTVEAVR